jgi:hypothetical protein
MNTINNTKPPSVIEIYMRSSISSAIVLGSLFTAMCFASVPNKVTVEDKDLKLLALENIKVSMKEGSDQTTKVGTLNLTFFSRFDSRNWIKSGVVYRFQLVLV